MLGVLFVSANWANAQLSGTSYTINSGVAASSTNFTSWASFATYFNTNGISGKTVVTVQTDDVANTAAIQLTQHSTKPTTSTNTLTIVGGSKILASSYAYEVLNLNGIDYVFISNLTIRNTGNGSYNQCVRLSGAADYCSFNNCIMEFTALTTTSTSGSAYFTYASTGSSPTSTSSTHNGSYDTIQNCTMRCVNTAGAAYASPGPSRAIIDQQGTSYYSNTASNNTLRTF